MIKKIDKQYNKIIILILTVLIVFNTIFIPRSYALGLINKQLSVLANPLQWLLIGIADDLNRIGATIFAVDDKLEGFKNDVGTGWDDLKNNIKQKGFLDAILNLSDDVQDAWFNLMLSPDDVFSGKVQIADANIFSNRYTENGNIDISDFNTFNHIAKQVKQGVAALYYIMRNLAAVILLCLLIYSGIRIVLSSSIASEQAKWRMYLIEWLKALALVMFIHVILIGIFYISDVITEELRGAMTNGNTIVTEIRKGITDTTALDGSGLWVYTIMYLYVTYLTFVFIVAYFKRFIYVMVLIVIAPIMSAMYAFGKTTKANFNRWIKEFTMGIMVQPFHMLIYSILIILPIKVMQSSGVNVTAANSGVTIFNYSTLDAKIYMLLSISMIRPCEKYLRKLFGFGETLLDNQASFESGKRTIDTTKKVVKQVEKTVATVALGVATAGVGLAAAGGAAAAGAAGAAGGAAGAAGAAGAEGAAAAGAASGVGGTAGGALGEAAGMAGEMSGAAGELGGIPGLDGLGGGLGEVGDTSYLGSGLDYTDIYGDVSRDPFHDDYFAGDGIYDDTMGLNEGPSHLMTEDELQNELNSYREAGYDDSEVREIEEQYRKAGHGDNNLPNQESQGTREDLTINNANVEINTADEIGVQQLSTLNADGIETLEGDIDADGIETLEGDVHSKGKDNDGLNKAEDNNEITGDVLKKVLGGGDLANSLGNGYDKFKEMKDKIQSNPAYSALTSSDIRNSLQDTRAAMHEFVDSLYMPGDTNNRDWNANIELKKEQIKKMEEKNINNFVNNKENQQKVIAAKGLKDTLNSRGQVVKSKEDKAKEILKGMDSYIKAGMNNPVQIMKMQAVSSDPKEAIKGSFKTEVIGQTKYNSFVHNTNNIQQMREIVADRMQIPVEKRNDVSIVQTINEQVQQQFKQGEKYITSGAATDSQTLNRLMELERKIDTKVDMVGSAGTPKETYVKRTDDILQKMVQKAVRESGGNLSKKDVQEFMKKNPVRLNGANRSDSVKEMQKLMNSELKSRLDNISSQQTTNRTRRTRTNSTTQGQNGTTNNS